MFCILNIEYPPAIALYADTFKIVILHIENVILSIFIKGIGGQVEQGISNSRSFLNKIRQHSSLRYSAARPGATPLGL
jgi:hypothetical protein